MQALYAIEFKGTKKFTSNEELFDAINEFNLLTLASKDKDFRDFTVVEWFLKKEDLASVKFFTNSKIEHADWEDVFDWINEKAGKIIGDTTIVNVKTFD